MKRALIGLLLVLVFLLALNDIVVRDVRSLDSPIAGAALLSSIAARLIASYGFGGVFLVAISVRPLLFRQVGLVALIAFGGGLLYQSVPGIEFYTGYRVGDLFVYALVLFALLFYLNAVLWVLFPRTISMKAVGKLNAVDPNVRGAEGITAHLRYAVSSDLWSPSGEGTVQPRDFAKRWFVTVAAATGTFVFSVLGSDVTSLLEEAFSPTRIVFTLLMAIVSVTLIGPIEDYVFDSRIALPVRSPTPEVHGRAPESRFEQIVQLTSPRAFGRFLLVLASMFALTGLHGMLENKISTSDSDFMGQTSFQSL
jgi:hypothetical protein